MCPCSVCEGGETVGGGDGEIINSDAAFICPDAEFVDNGHISGDGKVMLNKLIEGSGSRRRDIATCIVTVGVSGEGGRRVR